MVFEEIAVLLIAFSGYAVGHILANVASDEIKSGKVYFKLLRVVMLLSIVFFLLFFSQFYGILILPAILVALFLGFTFKKTDKKKESLGYLVLLLALSLTFFSENTQLIFLTGSLIFVFLLSSVAVVRR